MSEMDIIAERISRSHVSSYLYISYFIDKKIYKIKILKKKDFNHVLMITSVRSNLTWKKIFG